MSRSLFLLVSQVIGSRAVFQIKPTEEVCWTRLCSVGLTHLTFCFDRSARELVRRHVFTYLFLQIQNRHIP